MYPVRSTLSRTDVQSETVYTMMTTYHVRNTGTQEHRYHLSPIPALRVPVWRVYPTTGERSSPRLLLPAGKWQGMQAILASLSLSLSDFSFSSFPPPPSVNLYFSLSILCLLCIRSFSSCNLLVSIPLPPEYRVHAVLRPLVASSEVLMGNHLEGIPVVPHVINTISYRTVPVN